MVCKRISVVLAALAFAACAKPKPKLPEPQPEPKPKLTLEVRPRIMIQPGQVTFVARLSHMTEAFNCAATEMHYGDGCKELKQDFSCIGLPLIWTWQHTYRYYGSYKPALYLRDQISGKILEWAEADLDIPKPQTWMDWRLPIWTQKTMMSCK